jgi:FixJ family two-component response regulator
MNKQIAHEMKISEIMVKLHRGRMMKKLDARSVADVVRIFDEVDRPDP